jgi:hypothetical protein
MPLMIKTTGIEQYAPGGGAVLKMLLVGGPGVGKTRMSSFWPKPIYADCEGGLASVADRKVPFVSVNSTQDMLDFLAFMKLECRRPYAERQYQTVVIDTLDAFHRKVKDEWLQQNPGQSSFRGFEAWGFLETKMQMLLTRLLNLDCNVIVNCHFKDKTIKEGTGDNAVERQELMLQLQGDVKDSVYNDFDLVGYFGTFFAVEDGQRVQKRGLTFKATPDKPFLKDRLHITPPWMEVTFSDDDYAGLFGAFTARLDDLAGSEDLGEIPSEIPDKPEWKTATVGSGPVHPLDPSEIPLAQLDKPTLVARARALGLAFKGNTLKGELVAMIEEAEKAAREAPVDSPAEPAAVVETPAPAEVPAPAEPVTESDEDKPKSGSVASAALAAQRAAAVARGDRPQPATVEPAQEPVTDVSNLLQVMDDEMDSATALVQDKLGGQVTSDSDAADAVPMALDDTIARAAPQPVQAAAEKPAAEPRQAAQACQKCGADTSLGNQDYVKIGKIKFRLLLCNEHFTEAKATPNAPWIRELQQSQA